MITNEAKSTITSDLMLPDPKRMLPIREEYLTILLDKARRFEDYPFDDIPTFALSTLIGYIKSIETIYPHLDKNKGASNV